MGSLPCCVGSPRLRGFATWLCGLPTRLRGFPTRLRGFATLLCGFAPAAWALRPAAWVRYPAVWVPRPAVWAHCPPSQKTDPIHCRPLAFLLPPVPPGRPASKAARQATMRSIVSQYPTPSKSIFRASNSRKISFAIVLDVYGMAHVAIRLLFNHKITSIDLLIGCAPVSRTSPTHTHPARAKFRSQNPRQRIARSSGRHPSW